MSDDTKFAIALVAGLAVAVAGFFSCERVQQTNRTARAQAREETMRACLASTKTAGECLVLRGGGEAMTADLLIAAAVLVVATVVLMKARGR